MRDRVDQSVSSADVGAYRKRYRKAGESGTIPIDWQTRALLCMNQVQI